MPPTLLDSNIFIALDRKFSLSEAVQHTKEVLKETERQGFDPVILSCVLDEIHRKEIRSAVLECCRTSQVEDKEVKEIMVRVTHRLTQPGNLTDYKLIAAGIARAKDRPLLVSSDFLLRYEYAEIVETGDVMTPYQYTNLLEQRSPSPIMRTITKRLLNHFLEYEGPESFKMRQQDLTLRAEEPSREPVKEDQGRAALVAAYVSGKNLTKGQKKEIEGFRAILDRMKRITSASDQLLEVEIIRTQLCTCASKELDPLQPAFRFLGRHLVKKGQEAHRLGNPYLALRFMDEAGSFLALSGQGSTELYLRLGEMRAVEYLLKGDIKHSIQILQSLTLLFELHGDQPVVWLTMGVAELLSGQLETAEEYFSKASETLTIYEELRNFGDLFYKHRLYREALRIYEHLIAGGYLDDEMLDPLFMSAGILGRQLDDGVAKALGPQRMNEDNTKRPMPYLTRDTRNEWTILEDPDTPKFLRDPMRVCAIKPTPKGFLLICWNEGLSSRVGINIPGDQSKPQQADVVRLNRGPIKVKTTMLGSQYNIRGEIDTTELTYLDLTTRSEPGE